MQLTLQQALVVLALVVMAAFVAVVGAKLVGFISFSGPAAWVVIAVGVALSVILVDAVTYIWIRSVGGSIYRRLQVWALACWGAAFAYGGLDIDLVVAVQDVEAHLNGSASGVRLPAWAVVAMTGLLFYTLVKCANAVERIDLRADD